MKEAQASGYIKRGVLYIREEYWPLRDGEVVVTVTREVATRSQKANAYYWSVVLREISKHTGLTIDEVHDLCKAKFIPRIVSVEGPRGDVVAEFTIGGSTRGLDKEQFWQYVEDVREWASSELDLLIPDPDPNWKWRHLETGKVPEGEETDG